MSATENHPVSRSRKPKIRFWVRNASITDASVIIFKAKSLFAAPVRSFAPADHSAVADIIDHLDDNPWAEPDLSLWATSHGRTYVLCRVAGRDFLMTPTEARQVAAILFSQQSWAGASGVAVALDHMADKAARALALPSPVAVMQ